jgi:hypothetical protein
MAMGRRSAGALVGRKVGDGIGRGVASGGGAVRGRASGGGGTPGGRCLGGAAAAGARSCMQPGYSHLSGLSRAAERYIYTAMGEK